MGERCLSKRAQKTRAFFRDPLAPSEGKGDPLSQLFLPLRLQNAEIRDAGGVTGREHSQRLDSAFKTFFTLPLDIRELARRGAGEIIQLGGFARLGSEVSSRVFSEAVRERQRGSQAEF